MRSLLKRVLRLRVQRWLAALLFITFLCGILLGITLITTTDSPTRSKNEVIHKTGVNTNKKVPNKIGNTPAKMAASTKPAGIQASEDAARKYPEPNYNVHVFYYHWYGSPVFDKQYYHWNHEYLPHWDQKEAAKWPKGRHVPPDDIGSNYYPELGPYSSSDPAVINGHMIQLRRAGIGVLALSWYPPAMADDAGNPGMSDDMIPTLLDSADLFQLKVCFHIEPYNGRDIKSLRANISYIIKKYGSHPAFYQYRKNNKDLPFFYIYDSYLISSSEWARLFKQDGDMTVRNTDIDGIFIGLLVESKHKMQLLDQGGFDGFYTYFASEGFSFGSKTSNWKSFKDYASSKEALFIPSVGPGYIDDRVRPWNAKNTKHREEGAYYDRYWRAAMDTKPPIVSITSFNEWHEGTQIEAAVPKSIPGKFRYADYQPHEPDYYLSLTRSWSHKYNQLMKTIS